LTVLVVGKGSGKSSSGLTTVNPENQNSEREKVFQQNWFKMLPPTREELDAAGDGFE